MFRQEEFRFEVKCNDCNRSYEVFIKGNYDADFEGERERETNRIKPRRCKDCHSNNIRVISLVNTNSLDGIDFGIDCYGILGLPENSPRRTILVKGRELSAKLDNELRVIIPMLIKKEIKEEWKKEGKNFNHLEVEQEVEIRIRIDSYEYEKDRFGNFVLDSKRNKIPTKHLTDKRILEKTEELRLVKDAYQILFDNEKRKKYDNGFMGVKGRVACFNHQPEANEKIPLNGVGLWKDRAKKNGYLYFCHERCLNEYLRVNGKTGSSSSGAGGSSGDSSKWKTCYICQQKKDPTRMRKKRREEKYACFDCHSKFLTCHQCPKKCWPGSRIPVKEAGRNARFCSQECVNDWWKNNNQYHNNQERIAKEELKKIIDEASNGKLKTAEEIQNAIDVLKTFGSSPSGSAKKKAWDDNLAQNSSVYDSLQKKKKIVDLQNEVIKEVEDYWILKVGSLTSKINNQTIEQVLNQGLIPPYTWKTNLHDKTTRNEVIVQRNVLIGLINKEITQQQQQQQQHTPPFSFSSSSYQSNSGGSYSSANASFTNTSSQAPPSSSQQNDVPRSSSTTSENSTSNGNSNSSGSSSPETPSSPSSSIGSGGSAGSSSFGGGSYYPSTSSASTDSSSVSPESPDDKPISSSEKPEKPASFSDKNNPELENIVKTGQEILENDQANPEQIQEVVEKLKDYANSEDINKQKNWKDNQETNEEVLIQNIAKLISKQPLKKAKETVKQEIKQLQKTSKTFANLSSDWENKLEKLETSQQVANFVQKLATQTINQNKIEKIKSTTPTNNNKPNSKLIAAAGIGVLLLAGSAAVIFFFQKKKK
ncbi:hypothetical protein [endosymbiont GvMRE of Glomus versiforme]|uniref:hypothetical protein n=1 Tax=endosymbiont GvMRE of Glomus versiforme TaxID=2039283 RepID=UPI000ED68E13|nr:hypothetical protein [endosymbiont GvMRE of Glomus versiforme]RHZ36404.1 hypothetical protein GvMRE_Ic1g194 [endosymbiont GvMRE of Glomus versiforme]